MHKPETRNSPTQSSPGRPNRSDADDRKDVLAPLREAIDRRLDELLPAAEYRPEKLHTAMRYACLSQGKRVRPLMCLLINDAAGGAGRDLATDLACAVEMIHCCSLVLDDLPCMDDAHLRRGRSTTHREFGDATAILAAFGLLNRAMECVVQCAAGNDRTKAAAIAVLSNAIGSDGLIAGQEIDLSNRSDLTNVAQFETLNWLKTGVLFVASAELGGLAAGLDWQTLEAVRRFARHVGMAFQIGDDLIDSEDGTDSAGKDVCQDADKSNLLAILDPQAARKTIDLHLKTASLALKESGLESDRIEFLVGGVLGRYAGA